MASRSEGVSFEILQKHFDVPMTEAAKRFGVCLTFFKKICRTHGIKRWPFRKLKSLKNKISDLQTRFQDHPDEREDQLQRRLDELRDINSQSAYQMQTLLAADGARRVSASDSQPQSEDESNAPSSSEMPPPPDTDAVPIQFVGARQAQLVCYDDLRKSFDLPMLEAAKRFGVSLTLFKKICRKNGIGRWPHRKLKSLKNKVSDLRSRLQCNSQGSRDGELERRLDELRHVDSAKEQDCEQGIDELAGEDGTEEGHSSPHAHSENEEEDDEEVGALCLAMLSDSRYSEGSFDGMASVASADSQYSSKS